MRGRQADSQRQTGAASGSTLGNGIPNPAVGNTIRVIYKNTKMYSFKGCVGEGLVALRDWLSLSFFLSGSMTDAAGPPSAMEFQIRLSGIPLGLSIKIQKCIVSRDVWVKAL